MTQLTQQMVSWGRCRPRYHFLFFFPEAYYYLTLLNCGKCQELFLRKSSKVQITKIWHFYLFFHQRIVGAQMEKMLVLDICFLNHIQKLVIFIIINISRTISIRYQEDLLKVIKIRPVYWESVKLELNRTFGFIELN